MCAPYLDGDRDTREQGAVPVQLGQHLAHQHADHHLLAAARLHVYELQRRREVAQPAESCSPGRRAAQTAERPGTGDGMDVGSKRGDGGKRRQTGRTGRERIWRGGKQEREGTENGHGDGGEREEVQKGAVWKGDGEAGTGARRYRQAS